MSVTSYRAIFTAALILVVSVFLVEFYYLQPRAKHVKSQENVPHKPLTPPVNHDAEDKWVFNPQRDGRNHGLSDAQCDATFPDQYQEIDRALGWHKKNSPHGLSESDINPWHDGEHTRPQLRLMIYNGHVRYEFLISIRKSLITFSATHTLVRGH